jgi:hypothetical protein
MRLKESLGKLGEFASAVAKLGIEPETHLPKLVKTSSALDLRAVGLALTQKDLKDDVVIVPENGQDKNGVSVYLVDNELTRQVVEERYGRLLAEKGLRPIVRTKTIKRGDKEVIALHVPLLDAQVALAYTNLGVEIPKLYCGKTLDKKAGNYLTCGDEIREHFARFVLGEEPSIPIQERRERSKTLGGRIINIEEDLAEEARRKADVARQRVGSTVNHALKETPVVGRQLAKSAVDTLKIVGDEALLVKNLASMATKRGIVDGAGIVLTAESAAEKVIGKVTDAAQVEVIDLAAAAISRVIVSTLKKG